MPALIKPNEVFTIRIVSADPANRADVVFFSLFRLQNKPTREFSLRCVHGEDRLETKRSERKKKTITLAVHYVGI